MKISTPLLSLSAGLLFTSTQVFGASIGLGIGRTTEFSGSDDYTFIPTASFEIETPVGIFTNNRIGAQLDLIKSESVDTGPILRLNTGRNDTVSDAAVAALPEIDVSYEAGWFVESGFKLRNVGLNSNAIVIGSLSFVTDMGSDDGGSLIEGAVGLVMPINESLRVIPSVSLFYADDDYTHKLYGIDATNASAELGEYTAGGGLEQAQLAIVGIRQLNSKWSVTGVVAYNALQGDAAQSPITKRGSDTSVYTGVTAAYTF